MYSMFMNKVFSRRTILANILVLTGCVAMFPLLILFGNDYLFLFWIVSLIILGSCSISFCLRKIKGSGSTPASGFGAVSEVTQQKYSRKLAILRAFAVISGIIEIYFGGATIAAIVNPSPASIIVMFTLPISIANGLLLLILICACIFQKNK